MPRALTLRLVNNHLESHGDVGLTATVQGGCVGIREFADSLLRRLTWKRTNSVELIPNADWGKGVPNGW